MRLLYPVVGITFFNTDCLGNQLPMCNTIAA